MTSSVTEEKTLLQFLIDLLTDDDAREAFQQDPEHALQAAGLGDVSVEEVKELLPIVLHHVDPHCVADYESHCDEPDCYEAPTAWCEPEQEGCHYPSEDHHSSNIESVITHITYVRNHYSTTNNINVFENETNIWSGGGDVYFDQDIDYTSANLSGDHPVFIGGDNNGIVTNGDGNVTGDGNQVSGQGSTTAFGEGSAYSGDIHADNGGAIAFGEGDATATQENTDSHDDNHVDNSHQDNSTDASTHDSGNTIDSGNTVDSGNTDNSSTDNSDNSQDNHSEDNHSEDNDVDNSQQDNHVDEGFHFPI